MTTETQTSKAPTHIAWNVRKSDEREFWNRVGVAWTHSDSKGFTAELDALPRSGKIVFRTRSENPDVSANS